MPRRTGLGLPYPRLAHYRDRALSEIWQPSEACFSGVRQSHTSRRFSGRRCSVTPISALPVIRPGRRYLTFLGSVNSFGLLLGTAAVSQPPKVFSENGIFGLCRLVWGNWHPIALHSGRTAIAFEQSIRWLLSARHSINTTRLCIGPDEPPAEAHYRLDASRSAAPHGVQPLRDRVPVVDSESELSDGLTSF